MGQLGQEAAGSGGTGSGDSWIKMSSNHYNLKRWRVKVNALSP